jgi:DNA polymerase elongation subunit (family B)
MAVYHVAPKHLIEDIFAKLVKYFRDTRVKAKHSKEDFIDGIPPKLLAEAFKIVINSIYGKFGDENSPIFDRMATLRVTINGQLMILMLCEELELNGIEVISANTDGIVIKLYESKRETFNDIANRWKEYTGLDADSEEYKLYVGRDINNYLVQELNGKIDYKGAFNPKMYIKDLSKGYDMPIVAKAVENYFLYDIPVTRTLYDSTDILDFCRSQNVGKQFHVEETFVENGKIIRRESQRYVRYYVSNTGTVIEKVNNSSDKIRSKLCSGYYGTILNTLDDKPISERNINYRFYYAEAMKIINPIKLNIGNKKKSTLKKMTGMYNTLFDE